MTNYIFKYEQNQMNKTEFMKTKGNNKQCNKILSEEIARMNISVIFSRKLN